MWTNSCIAITNWWDDWNVCWIENEDCCCGKKSSLFSCIYWTTRFNLWISTTIVLHAFVFALNYIALNAQLCTLRKFEHWTDYALCNVTIGRWNEAWHDLVIDGASSIVNKWKSLIFLIESKTISNFNSLSSIWMIYFSLQRVILSESQFARLCVVIVETKWNLRVLVSADVRILFG